MSKPRKGTQEECDKLEYAVMLIESVGVIKHSPMRIVEDALRILDFGQLTPKQFLDYIEAVGK
jgi:hypothetical protein